MNLPRLYIISVLILILLTSARFAIPTTNFQFRRWKKNIETRGMLYSSDNFNTDSEDKEAKQTLVVVKKEDDEGFFGDKEEQEQQEEEEKEDQEKDSKFSNDKNKKGKGKSEGKATGFTSTILTRNNFDDIKKEKLSKPSGDNPMVMRDYVSPYKFKLYRTNKNERLLLKSRNNSNKLKKFSKEWYRQKILNKLSRLSYLKKLETFEYEDLIVWIDTKFAKWKLGKSHFLKTERQAE